MINVFINKAKRTDIPKDAVILTKGEALRMQWDIISNWKSKTDTWPFTIGLGVLASVNAATSLNVVLYFRNKLKLQNYGRISMAMPTVVIPSVLTAVSHQYLVTNEILLGESCPLCVQTRAAALQVAIGAVIPLLSTPVAAFFYADAYNTYNVPKPGLKNIPQFFSLWLVLLRKMKSKLPIIIGINAITAATLTYYEADSFYKMQSIIYENEERFRRNLEESRSQI
ncbi:uncharacterized protein LOC128990357 [Macrosteles quadrilineatus]|uniref:uncharacterized protein LOC128989863 n=1 Tax=Macrosteles quadrilineatus TaxID=74068 RepID=UPI0023E0A50D|nr:uncharacterized protein LOC128989863 [Macrosteles quadrilineatus]XP_054268677.1 uncharacterized protein LOC128990357 [Macrosteles quadrilineatus]